MANGCSRRIRRTRLLNYKGHLASNREDSLLKTRHDTRTVRFLGICRYVGVRQIDGARSNFYLAVRVSGIPWQKSMDSQDRSYARPVG